MLKNSLFQPSLSFLLQHLSSFFCFSGCLSFFSVSAALFLFSVPFFFFFQPYVFKVQPLTCCSLTQPKKPKCFSAFQPKRFCFSSATLSSCFFLLYSFLVQPKNVTFSPKRFFLQPKILFQFSPKISVQLQRLLLFVSFLPAFLFCLQPLRIALFQPKCSAQNPFQLIHVSLFE